MQLSATNSVVVWTFGVIFLATIITVLLVVKSKRSEKKQMRRNHKPPSGITRELSRVERGYKYVTDQSIGLIGCKFIMRSERPLEEDYFKSLVRCIWNYAPLLRMKIIEEVNEHDMKQRHMYFKELPESACDEVLSYRSLEEGGSLLEEVLREICIPFDASKGPLWRLFVYNLDDEDPSNTDGDLKYSKGVVMIVNHTVCDGAAMVEVYRKIVYHLHNFYDSGLQFEPVNTEIPMSLDDLVPKIRFPFWFEFAGKIGAKIFAATKFIPFRHEFLDVIEPPIATDGSITPAPNFLPLKMSKQFTQNLIKTAKCERCTVTGAIAAAMGIATVKVMQKGSISKTSKFRIMIPVDLRKYFLDKRYDHCIANYVSLSPLAVKCVVRPRKQNESEYDYFWELGRTISKDIRKLVTNSETIKAINIVAPFMDNPSFASDIFKKTTTHKSGGRIALFSVSNLGIINSPDVMDSFKVKIDEVSIGANEVSGGSIFSNNVATLDGCLVWNMGHAVHVVAKDTAQDVFHSLRQTLNSYPFPPN